MSTRRALYGQMTSNLIFRSKSSRHNHSMLLPLPIHNVIMTFFCCCFNMTNIMLSICVMLFS